MPSNRGTVQNYIDSNKSGRLMINGVDAVELADTHGTPLFIFSEPRILDNAGKFRMAFRKRKLNIKICYASKANSNMRILQTILNSGLDIEVNSGGELFKALKIGFQPDQIVFNGVAKTIQELKEAISSGIFCINIDSLFELERVIQVCYELQKRARVAFRVVPDIKTGTQPGLETGTDEEKFGISSQEIMDAYFRALEARKWLDVTGIHAHVGSQNTDIHYYRELLEKLLSCFGEICKLTGHKLHHINIGGGLPLTYVRDSKYKGSDKKEVFTTLVAGFDAKDIADLMLSVRADKKLIAKYGRNLIQNVQIILEPGRSIIGDAGILLTRIQNHKMRPQTSDKWLMLDAGFNILLESFDYNWYFHSVAVNKYDKPHKTRYKLAGPLCDGGDIFSGIGEMYRLLPEGMGQDDLIAFLDVGAYTLEQMFPYNGRPCAQAVMIDKKGSVVTIRQRDRYKDLIAKDVNFSSSACSLVSKSHMIS